jgi:hypothetical protein
MARKRNELSYRKNLVKMSKSGAKNIYVVKSSVKAWQRNGWTAADDGSSKTDSASKASAAGSAAPTTSENKE